MFLISKPFVYAYIYINDIMIVYDIFIDLILVDLDEKLHTFY